MKTFNFKSRNAISTVIGTFFFVIVMAGAFTAFILMMQTNSNFLDTQLDTTQNEIQKIQGQFTIAAAYDNSGTSKRLCVSVKNAGSTPLEIADLLIVNKTNNEVRQFDIDFRDAFVPVSSIRQILDNQPITLTAGTSGRSYDIKVVSTSGVTQTTELKVFPNVGSGSDPRFNVTGFVYPVSSASGQNVTVGMHVHNRMNTTLINVQANGDPLVQPSEAVAEGFNPSGVRNYTRLDPNEDALFLWEPEFVGGVGSKLNFTVRAKAFVEGCTSASFSSSAYIFNNDTVQLKVVPGVKRQILASPQSFLSIPAPFGQTAAANDNHGLFAIVVQNPTNRVMKVSQVGIQIVNPDNDDVFRTAAGSFTGVLPSGGTTEWTQTKNTVSWKGSSSITIKPFDMQTFLVRVKSATSITPSVINTVIVNVYSSFGQFGRESPLTFGVLGTSTAIVNVYARSANSAGTTSPIFQYSDLNTGETETFFFTIANNGSASVDFTANTNVPYMLINIPPGLRNISAASCTGSGVDAPSGTGQSLIEFEDGSMQLPIALTDALAIQTSVTCSMSADMPSISVPAHYIITLTANGTAGTAGVGAFSEIDLQVCPTSGCP